MVHLALVGLTTVIFGIASLLLISRARNKLSGGSIKKYLDNFAICVAFIIIFSVWQTLRIIFDVNTNITGHESYLTYPEYIFIVFAYVAFIFASFRVLKISEEFGFIDYGKKIEHIMKQKITVKEPTALTLSKPKRSSKKLAKSSSLVFVKKSKKTKIK